jgi:hypothetical protein
MIQWHAIDFGTALNKLINTKSFTNIIKLQAPSALKPPQNSTKTDHLTKRFSQISAY